MTYQRRYPAWQQSEPGTSYSLPEWVFVQPCQIGRQRRYSGALCLVNYLTPVLPNPSRIAGGAS